MPEENKPNVLEFKQALKRIIIQNSIEPSETGNCANFEDSLFQTNGLFDFSLNLRKTNPEPLIVLDDSPDIINLLIQVDQEYNNVLRDNILYYIAGYVIRHLLPQLECKKCHYELLMNANDPNVRKT